ncbi:MAG: GDYXXLXY domain-containing protein [Rhodobacteraceae bacterium]|nr:GDYXXLXY domain-containing protein [Paracoccaceae bacterium]
MIRRGFLIGGAAAAMVQVGALGKMIWDRAQALQSGREVLLATGFIDPRDLFRGHYVTLQLEISTLEMKEVTVSGDFDYGKPVFVELQEGDGFFATAKSVSPTFPENLTGPVIRGTSEFHSQAPVANSLGAVAPRDETSIRIDFPFDRYFAPKLEAKRLEKLRRDQKLGVILALDEAGNGVIKGITVDGEKVYLEPLL